MADGGADFEHAIIVTGKNFTGIMNVNIILNPFKKFRYYLYGFEITFKFHNNLNLIF